MKRIPLLLGVIGLLAGCVSQGSITQDQRVVLSMSAWAGMCGGLCIQEVAFSDDGSLHLDGRDWDDTIYIDNAGTLTSDGLAQLEDLEADLADLALEPVYGCPDCADGGGMTVDRRQDDGTASTDYPWGSPPEELEDLDVLFFEILEALRSCTASSLVEIDSSCEPFDW
jgi:hypothetical protein